MACAFLRDIHQIDQQSSLAVSLVNRHRDPIIQSYSNNNYTIAFAFFFFLLQKKIWS